MATKIQNETRHGGCYREILPGLARGKGVLAKLWTSDRWIADLKADGWRYLGHFGGDCDRLYLTGRPGDDPLSRLPENGACVPMLGPVTDVSALGYTVVDGELLPPVGRSFEDLSSIMNSGPAVSAQRIAEMGAPRYFVFDVLFVNGTDVRHLPLRDRMALRDTLMGTVFKDHPHVSVMPAAREDKEAFFYKVLAMDGEGVILKDLDAKYGEGWVKVKRTHTLDTVITGFEPGKGKYTGSVGAIIVSVLKDGALHRVGRASGMTDKLRDDMNRHPERYVGQVVEVVANKWMRSALRHPRFLRMRPDSSVSSCTWEKMHEDLKQHRWVVRG